MAFSQSTLQSALDRLSSHLQKQPPSSSQLHTNLAKLHQSLLNLTNKLLPLHSSLPNHTLTKLQPISYSVDDLVDDIEYNSLQQETQEFTNSNPYRPLTGPSISQFRGLPTAENEVVPEQVSTIEQESNQVHNASKFKFLRSWIGKMCSCCMHRSDVPQQETAEVDDVTVTERNESEDVSCEADALEDRIGKMVAQLDSFAASLEEIQHIDLGSSAEDDPKNYFIDGNVYGRDDEKELLVKMLLESDNENIRVVPLVGLGGIGKTVLSQYVYSDERVEKHFHAREWICASDSFDMMRVAGDLEPSLYSSGPYDRNQLLDLFESKLKVSMEGKRFLLVLDDVRSVEWVTRLAAIGTGRSGSKILVTTRDEKFVDEASKRNLVHLEGMGGEGFWSFFKICSFGDVDPDRHPELQSIGKEISEKLEGSPLAAKLVGGALREKLDYGHWRIISRSELWDSRNGSGDVMPALRLSYKHIPPHLQRCFSFCSVFPKGYAFAIEKLVQVWMAHGLIRSSADKRAEDIGQEYFARLRSRSFFELPAYSKSYWRKKFYLMGDSLHSLAESVCFNDCFVYESGEIPKGVRHLSLVRSVGLNSVFEWGNLRTLMINTTHATEFEVLKRVRVLDLSHSYMKQLPEAIGYLTHLRYLDLSGNDISSLPESLCKLHHLQSLLAPDRCHRLPKGMTSLINLRHLTANDAAISWIAGIGRLTRLQELSEFIVRKTSGHDLGQLKGMEELHGLLCIQCLDDVKDKEEAVEANLKGKIHIKRLQLKWMRWNRNRRPDAHEEVLECLQPPTGLEELGIHWYGGVQSPSWLDRKSLENLKFIHLRGCKKWNRLPPLGQLSFLNILKIEDMDAVVNIDIFPSLEELWLENTSVTIEGLQEQNESGCKIFPRLRKLSAKNCDRLKGLPPLSVLSTLEEVDIRKCPDLDSELPDCLKYLTSLTKLSISELQLTTFPEEVFCWLRHLEVDSCENLTSWIADEKEESNISSLTSLSITNSPLPTGPVLSKHLKYLRELRISSCSKLNSFTLEQNNWFKELAFLRELTITDCKSLRFLPRELHHLDCLEKLTIAGCPMVRSLPTGLPLSLKWLQISNCTPGLAVQWQNEEAPEWVKNIPYRYIV